MATQAEGAAVSVILTALAIVVILAVFSCLWVLLSIQSANNTLVALDQRCNTAQADIDVQLRHRHDLIPSLVEVTKGLATQERELLLGLAQTRAQAMTAMAPQLRMQAEGNLTSQIGTLLAAAERYPELRSLPEFGELRRELVDCADRITASRRFFNLAIEEYNTAIRSYPGCLIAQRRNMNTRQPFDLGIERMLLDEPVAVKF